MSQYTKYPVVGGGGGSGTVTSVGLAAPASILTVSGSPVTTSGTLTLTLATQTANTVWAGPTTGSAATPTFRSLVAGDIPALPYSSNVLTSAHIFVGNGSNVATDVAMSGAISITNAGVTAYAGTVPINKGGTNLTSLGTANQILGVNSGASALEYKTLTAGNNISIVNAAGSITISSSSTISSINSNTAVVSGTLYFVDVSGGAVSLTLPAATASLSFRVKDSTGSALTNNITIVRAASESIEGIAADKILSTSWGSWSFICDGTNWFMV